MNNKKVTTDKDIKKFLKELKQSPQKLRLSDFHGKLQGIFGDGLAYQKKIREEWDR